MPMWNRSLRLCFLFVGYVLVAANCGAASPQEETVQFNRDVRPILAKHCLACHGRDETAREAELRLDIRAAALKADAIVPGDIAASQLMDRIRSKDPAHQMPPPETGDRLTDNEKNILGQWISAGAAYEVHWSFTAPLKSALPKIKGADWPLLPMDHFILHRLESSGLKPTADAERAMWLRRVSLDLTGLPPSLDEAEAFHLDRSEKAFEKVVDRLLDSDAYGEHWARMWLDLARYADTKGYEKDRHRNIWRFRDWVIAAFNNDMPYDQFTRDQLAGDLVPNRTTNQILATAFHRNTMTNDEGGTDNEEFRIAAVKDRVDTTMQVWMGLTMGCAKCHTHKYDPISLTDYYSFFAFFNQTQDADNEGPFWPTPTKTLADKISSTKALVAQLESSKQQRSEKFLNAFELWKKSINGESLWETLALAEFSSNKNVKLIQNGKGQLIAQGERPDKDTWTLTFALAKQNKKFTAVRIDYLPQATAGGEWPDANVAIRELTAELVLADGSSRKLKLKNPRASYSQRSWEIHKSIDGKAETGWGLSPKFNQPQTGIYEFDTPVSGEKLKLILEQEYGEGLLLARSRISISSQPGRWLAPVLAPDLENVFANHVFQETIEAEKKLQGAKVTLKNLESQIPKTPVMLELDPGKLRKTKIHNRGNFLDQGQTVQPSVVSLFGPLPNGVSPNRLAVAQWLVQKENPLTARVMVNRIWARLFGVGIVETEEDFGTQGLPPSHPFLLDWLAVDFRENDWSIKNLLRTIVLSRTYRQGSQITSDRLTKDPRNRLLSRGPRFRLSAEAVRDQALFVSGLLTRQIGGPSVMPPQPGGIWKSTYSGEKWKNAIGKDRYRRGIYTYRKRTSPYPAMTTFDAGSGEVCQIRRVRTNTPLQALVILNDTAFVEAAGSLAKKMETEPGSVRQKIAVGFRIVLVRDATPAELDRLVILYDSLEKKLLNQESLLRAAGRQSGDARLTTVANVLLNLDETLMKP